MKDELPKKTSDMVRYSGMAFQLAGSTALGFFIGYKLDQWMKNDKPYFTTLLAILFLIANMYLIFKDLLKKK